MTLVSPDRPQPGAGALTSDQCRWVRVEATVDLPWLLDHLERAHFAAVEWATAGLIRCRRRKNHVACLILDRWPALLFGEPETAISGGEAWRQWPIVGGVLARPGGPLGVLRLGVAHGDDDSEIVLSSAVRGFPSRFLGDPPSLVPRPVWRLVGRLYRGYHRQVSSWALRMVAAALQRRASPAVRM